MNQRVVDVILEAAEEDYLAGVKETDTFAAELALFGATLVTAGDLLATISAALALRQIYFEKIHDQKNEKKREAQMKDIQDQLTLLKKEIKALRGK